MKKTKLKLSVLFVLCVPALIVTAGPGHSHGNQAARASVQSAGHSHSAEGAGNHSHARGDGHAHTTGQSHAGHSHGDGAAHKHGDGHSHAGVKRKAGPNGGRVIHSVEPHAEFLVNKERKIQITFLDDEGNAVAPAGQSVTVTTGTRANPLRLTFTEVDGVLLSDAVLPAGDNLPVVLQIRAANAKPVTERFNANLAQCPTCAYAEYACVCEGHS